jgi:hypothetical protein
VEFIIILILNYGGEEILDKRILIEKFSSGKIVETFVLCKYREGKTV